MQCGDVWTMAVKRDTPPVSQHESRTNDGRLEGHACYLGYRMAYLRQLNHLVPWMRSDLSLASDARRNGSNNLEGNRLDRSR